VVRVREHVFVRSTNHKGNVAELAIAAEAARLGIPVLKPLTEHEVYDLVFELGGRLLRVQCKWSSRKGRVIHVHVGRCRTTKRGYVRSVYLEDEIDALATYCEDLDRCYLLPASLVAGKYAVHLRLEPPRNMQRAALNWASQYELGAVAQWEERLSGTQEVTGSSPVSSTPFPLKDTVGMDEFDARIAHYVRRAEAGEETLITRWGKPVARLVPVQGSLLEAAPG
jgi:prevent-host-death family protein